MADPATSSATAFADDVRQGLTAVQKAIPPRHFYDELGSALFEAICRLPEYYVTRAENELLGRHGADIAAALGPVDRLVELGSGSSRKTRLLLNELTAGGRALEYVPVDIDATMLEASGRDLQAEYPSLTVTPLAQDFQRAARRLRRMPPAQRTAVLFLGSTIGNLHGSEVTTLLREFHEALGSGDTMLIGADLRKPKPILDAAYNDSLGITAAFNLNLLQRINRELGGQFDLRCFTHRAFYDEAQNRIEMHLVSIREQTVRIESLGLEIAFHEGETIHTENSYKYDDETIESLAATGGFKVAKKWTDEKNFFAEYLLKKKM